MTAEGPDIRVLTRHLAECPPSFLEEPVQPSGLGGVHVQAVLSDLLVHLGGPKLTAAEVARFSYTDKRFIRVERNRLRVCLVGAWLFSHRELRTAEAAERIRGWLADELDPLAALVQADSLVTDPDRREEFARLGLSVLGLRPAGESVAQSQNRLSALSSVERERVVAESRAAEERARLVREEIARKQAEAAAASSYNNE